MKLKTFEDIEKTIVRLESDLETDNTLNSADIVYIKEALENLTKVYENSKPTTS